MFGVGFATSCIPTEKPEMVDSPINLVSSAVTDISATLSWDDVAEAESYLVRINGAAPVAASSNSYRATGLTPETDYTWAVVSLKGEVRSTWSEDATFRTLEPTIVPIGTPENLVAIDVTFTSAVVGWDAVADATGYMVRLGDAEPVAVEELTYTFAELTPQTAYMWTVCALRGDEVGEWAPEATFTTKALPAVVVPANLTTTDITFESATLGWDAVDGATGYEVSINDGAPIAVTDITFALTGLAPETGYTWTVRTVEGERMSAWAAAVSFTTLPEPAVEPEVFTHALATSYGDWFGIGGHNFLIELFQFDYLFDMWDGYHFYMDMASPAVDMSPDREYLDMPEGVYNFQEEADFFTVVTTGVTAVDLYEEDYQIGGWYFDSGTLTIAGNHSNYTLTMDVMLDNGERFLGTYTGPILVPNPNYVPPTNEPNDFGTIPIRDNTIYYYYDPLGDGSLDGYVFQGMSETVWVDELGYLQGTGWYIGNVQINAPLGSGLPIPDNTYTILDVNEPGSVLAGYTNMFGQTAGLWARKVEEGVVTANALLSGTVVTTYDGTYRVVIDATGDNGQRYIGTITGTGEGLEVPIQMNTSPLNSPRFAQPANYVEARPAGAPVYKVKTTK
jgi:hypothetical protein